MEYSLGIDIGSVGAKAVLFDGSIVATALVPTGWSPKESGRCLVDTILAGHGLTPGRLVALVATGYGRGSLEGATHRVTEITCHAAGARFLSPGCRSVLDVGGQDSKVISLDEGGAVADFAMNDRCAAGTGRFLQMAAHALGYELSDFLSVPSGGDELPVSSMCAVFAETELVNHLARGADRAELARGIFRSVAKRCAAMLGRLGIAVPLLFTGGLAHSGVLVSMLESELGHPVAVHRQSQFAGALGAALMGWKETRA